MSYITKDYLAKQFNSLASRITAIFAKKSELPTKISDLTNDSNFVEDSSYNHTDNNFTDSLLSKLNGIESSAQANVIENIIVNGTKQTVANKTVALTVMTNAVSDLVNYYTKTETYTKSEVNGLISAIPKFDIKVVDSKPTADISETTIYLLRNDKTSGENLYTEYIYSQNKWEILGEQALDLSGYVTTTQLNTALENYVTKTDLSTALLDYVLSSDLATVATSGSYNDLTDKPTIPTVNNATLTIQKNGTNVQTFTANSSSNKTANILVPSGNYYGTCDTDATTASKVVTISSDQDFELKVGARITVLFTKANNTATNPTLNVNNTGAKEIWYDSAVLTTGTSRAGRMNTYISYIYDGTYWVFNGWSLDWNTEYGSMSLTELQTGTATNQRTLRADVLNPAIQSYGTAFGECDTESTVAEKMVTLADSNWKLRVGAIIGVKYKYTNTASNPTLNVNGSGAKSIFRATSVQTAGNSAGQANYIMYYMYDGTNWNFISWGVDNNTTYSAMSTSELTTGTATASRVVRADYLKAGIDSLIDTKIDGLDYYTTSEIDTKLDAKEDVQSIALDNETTTILENVKALGTAKKFYARFTCGTNGGSTNISDIPVTGISFICEAYCVRWASTTDYTYRVIFWSASYNANYYANIQPSTTAISWFGTNFKTYYFTSTTARNVLAKTVSASGFALDTGMRVFVRFTDTTSSSNPSTGNITLNINNTGAKQIKIAQNNTVLNQGYGWMFCSNRAWELVYDGTYWNVVNYDTNTWQGNGIKTYAAQTGTVGTDVTETIAANTTMDNAHKTLLNNDTTLDSLKQGKTLETPIDFNSERHYTVEELLQEMALYVDNVTEVNAVLYWNKPNAKSSLIWH